MPNLPVYQENKARHEIKEKLAQETKTEFRPEIGEFPPSGLPPAIFVQFHRFTLF
jgi:hypothetical protein